MSISEPPSRQPLVQLPGLGFAGINDLGVARKNVPEAAQLTACDQLFQRHTARLKVLAVRNHQANAVGLAGRHHPAAILY
jgi:hypothetical protein